MVNAVKSVTELGAVSVADERIQRVAMPKWGLSMKPARSSSGWSPRATTVNRGDELARDRDREDRRHARGGPGGRAAPHRRPAGRGDPGRRHDRAARPGRGARRRRSTPRPRRPGAARRRRGRGGGRAEVVDRRASTVGHCRRPWSVTATRWSCWSTATAATRARGCSSRSRSPSGRRTVLRARPARARRVGQGRRRRQARHAGRRGARLPRRGRTSPRRTWSGTRSAARSSTAVAAAAPDRVRSLTLVAPAGFGTEADAEYLRGFAPPRPGGT